ncbi:MAG: C25 family cysteine peptidase [Roseiflexaceae bacterium]
MDLITSSRDRLRAVYGADGARRVAAALRQLLAARPARGTPTRLAWIEEGLPDLGVAGAAADPEAISQQFAELSGALGRAGARLESILIAGGPDIVPFYEAPNPTPYDGDLAVPCDCFYGACNPYALLPEWAVGRIPGAAGGDPTLLLRLLGAAATYKPAPAGQTPKVFGYSTAAWRHAAAEVYAEIPGADLLLVSPPTLAATLDRRLLDWARRVYCNLHGVRDGPLWYGQPSDHGALVVALRPADLAGLDLSGAVVVSEACYGAAIGGRDEHSSLALAFLARGAAGFLGATAISYGPPSPPTGEADLIAMHFLRALRAPGATLGGAFMAARTGMLRDTLAHQATLDEDDQKTLLEFVLYGDPTLVVG